jgi:hypothetical protein
MYTHKIFDLILLSNETQDLIASSSRVLVRQTTTGFKQGAAALVRLLTVRPLESLTPWETFRGVKGK